MRFIFEYMYSLRIIEGKEGFGVAKLEGMNCLGRVYSVHFEVTSAEVWEQLFLAMQSKLCAHSPPLVGNTKKSCPQA